MTKPHARDQDKPRIGDWILTATGRKFWPLDPRPDEICIEDIAHGLSNICRYSGHTKSFYSVAQHSALVARFLPDHLRMWGLLHDAAEAYVSDVARPLKPFLRGFDAIEDRVLNAVALAFGLAPGTIPEQVKRVDDAILADEFRCLMPAAPPDLRLPATPLGIEIEPWPPVVAHDTFMRMFREIEGNDE